MQTLKLKLSKKVINNETAMETLVCKILTSSSFLEDKTFYEIKVLQLSSNFKWKLNDTSITRYCL